MQVIILENAQQVAQHASRWVVELISQKTNPVLGLATGSTPISLYQKLVKSHQEDQVDFGHVTSFNLDEYHNIDAENEHSYRTFMKNNLFDKINIDQKNTHLPTCNKGENPREQGIAFEDKIRLAGGIDLQILGIGANGHIGFNEPTSSLSSRTRLKTLTKQTLEDNSRLFQPDEYQPTMAMTMGISTILDAQYILLMATGKNKAKAVNEMITGPLSAKCPASALQLHEHAVIILDKAAASELSNQEYFNLANNEHQEINKEYGFYI
ncbi:glucosamine-6-phosphate deaminase [Shewanella eurypsychrophilus]|uniref:Glucosamine-6-phosphate deaminase n=1 Tax=Shewanella eurypsychrophilus TaxID=2593656 RepID=A0ABX6V4T5_9GAMM|nr:MULTISPECIES: glucosamine-6-phosphate deaminase [Shewanella]QFU22098.1 glucosamine-6-phosphate deaminase [Shewanella sp. YLB-09]QPG57386.1 glucosamine-6-phosphate deaminase [Shewanella eurypsychrophilus]